jgi:O-antigen ligase
MLSEFLAPLFAFALMVAYWPGVAGIATTPRWDVAALLSIALFAAPRVRMTAAHWIGLALVGWMLASLIWNDGGADGRADGIDAALQMVIAATAFALGSTMLRIDGLLAGAAIGIGVNSAFAIAQHFGYGGIPQHEGCCAGLFFNRNSLAAVAAMVGVGLLTLPRLWVLLPLVLPALILAPSRAAWLALILGWMAGSRFAWFWAAMAALVGIAVLLFSPLYEVHLDPSSNERLMIWHDTIDHLNWFGHGLGAFREDFIKWFHYFDIFARHTRPEHPHNELLGFAFEGGVPAVALLLAFALAIWFAGRERSELGILAGLAVLSMFAMPFHDPATVVLGALCAGYLVGGDARSRDGALDGGKLLRAWVATEADRAKPRVFAGSTSSLSVPTEVS